MSGGAAAIAIPARNGILRRVRRLLHDAYVFVRFPALSFTLVIPLLGAGTATTHLGGLQIAGLCTVAFLFHVFAYVSNDVIDLPIDRTEPLRSESPLIRGAVEPWQALTVALAQVPVALLVCAWLGGGARACGALSAAFVLMTAYNLLGKRSRFPPMTDAVQGLAWVSLALFGVAAANARPTASTAFLSAHVFLLTLMVNGIHGGVRDVANDDRCRARTTALLLGARVDGHGRLSLPAPLLAYALALQGLLVGVAVAALGDRIREPPSPQWVAAVVAVTGLSALSVALMVVAYRSRRDPSQFITAGMLHLVVSVGLLPATYGPYLSPRLGAISVGVYVVPILAMWACYGMRWQIE